MKLSTFQATWCALLFLTPILAREPKQQTQHLQVLNVCDAPERLPRDALDLVLAQISKTRREEANQLKAVNTFSASHYNNKTMGGYPPEVSEALFSLRPLAVKSLYIVCK